MVIMSGMLDLAKVGQISTEVAKANFGSQNVVRVESEPTSDSEGQEALNLLNSALDQNGYATVRNDRTLTIYNKEDAKKQDLPVKSSNKPEEIPKNDEMVTQIIPVRFISAVQVSRDLQPLLPDKATMTANEGGNALIITDTQISIHRMAEIIKALDTAVSSVSAVKVFPLRYADAKAVAGVIKDLFAPQDTARNTGSGDLRPSSNTAAVTMPPATNVGSPRSRPSADAVSRTTAVAPMPTAAAMSAHFVSS